MVSPVSPRLLVALLLAACIVAVLPSAADAKRKAKKRDCANTQVQPAAGNLDAVRAAVLCLVNRERAASGLPGLKELAKLRKAAEGHSRDMVEERFFDHDSLAGADMVDRPRAGYVRYGALVARREHRLGQRHLATAARRSSGLDGLAGPPREHPQPPLPRHRHRRRARRARAPGLRAAPPTRRTSGRGTLPRTGIESRTAAARDRLGIAAAMADVRPLRALHYDLDRAGSPAAPSSRRPTT